MYHMNTTKKEYDFKKDINKIIFQYDLTDLDSSVRTKKQFIYYTE